MIVYAYRDETVGVERVLRLLSVSESHSMILEFSLTLVTREFEVDRC